MEHLSTHALATELRILNGQLTRRLREQSHAHDLTASQKSVIIHLDRTGPATVTTLARAEGVKPQSMGATVASLEAAGLLVGSPDPTDGRQTILALTPRCLELLQTSRAAKEDWLFRAIQARLSPEEEQQLTSALDLLKRLLTQ